jgi:hypothetical protein
MENLNLENLKNELATQISNMSSGEMFELINTFCIDANYHDDMVFELQDDVINEILEGKSPIEIIRLTAYGEFNYTHDYFRFDGYGNLESLPYLDSNHLPDYLDNIIDYIVDNCTEFEHIFDGLDELVEIATANEEN